MHYVCYSSVGIGITVNFYHIIVEYTVIMSLDVKHLIMSLDVKHYLQLLVIIQQDQIKSVI